MNNSLQTNSTLTALECDGNQSSVLGYQALLAGLKFNVHIVHLRPPHEDLTRLWRQFYIGSGSSSSTSGGGAGGDHQVLLQMS